MSQETLVLSILTNTFTVVITATSWYHHHDIKKDPIELSFLTQPLVRLRTGLSGDGQCRTVRINIGIRPLWLSLSLIRIKKKNWIIKAVSNKFKMFSFESRSDHRFMLFKPEHSSSRAFFPTYLKVRSRFLNDTQLSRCFFTAEYFSTERFAEFSKIKCL